MTQTPERSTGDSFLERLSRLVGSDVDPEVQLDGGASLPGDSRTESDSELSDASGSGSSGVVARMQGRPGRSRRYRIEGEIARGGMGVIREVWDEDLRRRLAMKVALGGAKPGSSTAASELDPRLLSRFLEEAQVTGQLEHPGIVPVHELGIDDAGVVFFTMQLVRGANLEQVFGLVPGGGDGWSVTRALGVLLKVSEAMAYAHSKGVIHRDLKPANVMVGDFGEVYVMDWGLVRVRGKEDRHDVRIAKSEGVQTDERTDSSGGASDALYTMDGDVLGTPAYMSPEQARGEVDQLDERTDVYALGAMLYHLLAGAAPYGRPQAPPLNGIETLTALLEGPPPPLSELTPNAPSELIAIAEKAMAREPGERYPDMRGLGEDLRAFLENRVVQAYQTGAIAEARKWVRRNRPLAASIAAGLLILVAGLVVSLVLKAQADGNAERARRQASIAREVADFMNDDLLAAIAPEQQGIDVTVREVLAISSARLRGRFEDEPLVEAELRRTIGTSFERLGEYEQARGHLERAEALFESELGLGSEAALTTASAVGSVWATLGRFEDARAHLEDVVRRSEERFGPNASLTLSARAAAAEVLWLVGDLDGAAARYADLEGTLRQELGDRHTLTLSVLVSHAGILQERGDLDSAEELQVEALAALRATLGEGHPRTLGAADVLGEILVAQGRSEEAEELLLATQATREEVLGPDHPGTANGLGQLGTHYFVQGRIEQAREQYARGYDMLRRSLGSEHRLTLVMAGNLAGAEGWLGRREEAVELYRSTLEAQQRTLGPEHPHAIRSLGNLAAQLHALGRYAEAEAAYLECIELREAVFGADHLDTWSVRENLSGLWSEQGRLAESIELSKQVLDGRRRTLGPKHPSVARTLYNLGLAALKGDDDTAARGWFEEAYAIGNAAGAVDVASHARAELGGLEREAGNEAAAREAYLDAALSRRAFGIEDESVADWLYEAGRSAHRLGDYDASALEFEQVFELRRKLLGDDDTFTLQAMVGLTRTLQAAERFGEAETWALGVHERFLARDGAESTTVAQARDLLVSLYEAWGRASDADQWR